MLPQIPSCPGLFYNTVAQDGMLARIRIPGGMINSQQCQIIADIAENYGGGYVDVTNRANLQIREIKEKLNSQTWEALQNIDLVPTNPQVDHIRNIMTSPTAGIDIQEIIDTRELLTLWNNYIVTHPELSNLSAKFSVGFDGGGLVSITHRPNDIIFSATTINHQKYFRVALNHISQDLGILVPPNQCLALLTALTRVYLNHSQHHPKPKPRLKEILNNISPEHYLQQAEKLLPFPLKRNIIPPKPINPGYQHIGIHPQRQADLFYIGIVLPLGRIDSQQIRNLATLATKHGSGNLRLTPWQNLLLTDIPGNQLQQITKSINNLNLDFLPTNAYAALVACTGRSGCAAAATDAKTDALALADYLPQLNFKHPINIHFSGCEKSCAQQQGDITLVGIKIASEGGIREVYDVYIGKGEAHYSPLVRLGYNLYSSLETREIPRIIEKILEIYQSHRAYPEQSFEHFIRDNQAQLKQLFA